MCARYSLTVSSAVVAAAFQVAAADDLVARYNVAPTQEVPGVVEARDGRRVLWSFRWGLVPFWAKEPSIGTRLINARAEGIAEKAAFRDSFTHRRVLLVADGYYEWRQEGGVKQPYHVRRIDRAPFALGGLYAKWKATPDAEHTLVTCTVITVPSNALVARIHDRMPLVVPPERYGAWIARDLVEPAAVVPMLTAIDPADWEAVPVDRRVSNVRNDDAACLDEVGPALRA
jgi:putative SOS response-associated peptidase YedK